MSFSNPYTKVLETAQRKYTQGSIQYLETLAINLGFIHNTFGTALKQLLILVSQQAKQSRSEMIEEKQERNSKKVREMLHAMNSQVQQQINLSIDSNNQNPQQQKSDGIIRSMLIQTQLQIVKDISKLDVQMSQQPPLLSQAPSSFFPPPCAFQQTIQCFICRKAIEPNPDCLCSLCASKQPIIYELE